MLQVTLSKDGKYRAGNEDHVSEFEVTKKVLGSGACAGDIVVVKDKQTGTEHARKQVCKILKVCYLGFYSVIFINKVHCPSLTAGI